jgi:thiol-disulfide isomerase/thioredoxin
VRETPATASVAGSGEVGERLATYSLTSIDGEPVKVAAGKPGAVYFMAGWCGSCLPEAEALGRLERGLGDRISVLAVSPDPSDSVSAIRGLRAAAGNPSYPFAWDRQGTLARALDVGALDTTLVYDARGKVVDRDPAPTDLATLKAAFRKAGVS